jgi:hypothetical protein
MRYILVRFLLCLAPPQRKWIHSWKMYGLLNSRADVTVLLDGFCTKATKSFSWLKVVVPIDNHHDDNGNQLF